MKKDFIIFLILISLLIIPIVYSLASIFTNKSTYNKLETVNIEGTGFTLSKGISVAVKIWDPNNNLAYLNVTMVNNTFGFSAEPYIIPDNRPSGTWTITANTSAESAQVTFTVSTDKNPLYYNFKRDKTVVTILDVVQINVTWEDDVNMANVFIWENRTGNWVGHQCVLNTGVC